MSEYWDRYMRRRFSRRTFVATGATAALGTAAILAGCGDDDDSATATATATKTATASGTSSSSATSSGTASGTASSTGTAVADDPKRYGGTFRISTLDPYRGLDPAINTLVPTFHSAKNYSRTHLFQVSTQKQILDMATAIEQPDPTTIRYTIRPDIKFHNVAPMNGRLVTSKDLAFSWQRFADVGKLGSTLNASAWSFLDLPAIQTPDDKTIVVKLKAPAADALAAMGQHFYGIVAKEVVDANGGDLTKVNTAGSGPYILTQADINTQMTYTKNKDYFSHDHSDPFWFPKQGGYFDKFQLNIIKDVSTVQAQLISGDLDGLYFNALNVDKALATDFKGKGLQVVEGKANEHVGLGMVLSHLSDTKLRQAMMKGIDYDGFIKTIYLGDGIIGAPLGGGFPETVRLPESELKKYLTYDPKTAKQMWEAAGGPTKFPKLTLLNIAGFPFMEQSTTFIKQSLQNSLGVTVDIVSLDIPSWLAKVTGPNKDFDLYVFFDQSLPDLPSTNAIANYNPVGSSPITTQWDVNSTNPDIANLAKQALDLYTKQDQTLKAADRTQPMYAFQRFVLDNAVPAIPLPVHKTQYMVANKRLQQLDKLANDTTFWNNQMTINLYLNPTTP